MGSIYVPPRSAMALWRQNLMVVVLKLINQRDEAGLPVQALRDYAAFKAQLDGMPTTIVAAEVERAERLLLGKGLIRTDGVTLWVAPLADLKAFLAKGEESPLIVPPNGAAA